MKDSFLWGRESYPLEVKMKAIELRLAGIPTKQILQESNIRNYSHVKWYKGGELHRLKLPVGIQYTYD